MRERFRDARVGRLATVTDEGHPHVVPCCFALAADDEVVYSAVDAKPKSTLALRRLANLRAQPYASLLVDHYADDWSALWWIRVDGAGRVIDGGPERDLADRAAHAEVRAIPIGAAARPRRRDRRPALARLALRSATACAVGPSRVRRSASNSRTAGPACCSFSRFSVG